MTRLTPKFQSNVTVTDDTVTDSIITRAMSNCSKERYLKRVSPTLLFLVQSVLVDGNVASTTEWYDLASHVTEVLDGKINYLDDELVDRLKQQIAAMEDI